MAIEKAKLQNAIYENDVYGKHLKYEDLLRITSRSGEELVKNSIEEVKQSRYQTCFLTVAREKCPDP
ncbi:hypothetical protein TNCT_528581 [Trichonephila clavata]|uniref:Uncharacterized protein n=1 Tax=Trichonephila clavata TaxID=2740835 RepID=A0A8X6J9E5_TRICU|nr:hypothetical protein TNCT_528581 [Trichonephila clavata]